MTSPARSGRPGRILLVDDDGASRDLVRVTLERDGHGRHGAIMNPLTRSADRCLRQNSTPPRMFFASYQLLNVGTC